MLYDEDALKAWESQRNESMRQYELENIETAKRQAKQYTHSKLLKHHCSDKAKTAAYCRTNCKCVCVWALALSIQEGYEISVTLDCEYHFTPKIESEDKYIMNACKYYKGTERITDTSTKIKCSMMPDNGRVFENKDEEGKEIISCCWNGGGSKCPYYTDETVAATPESEAEQSTLLDEMPIHPSEALTTERQEKAIKLHKQVLANGKIAADCMVAMGRDLKVIRDEKLFSEFDCENFEEYCEKKVGIGKRHGYNFIQVYERFGEQRLTELQGLGITKLLEIAKLDDEDMADLMQNGNVSEMSVRQLQAEMEKYKNKCEQLTLDLEDERDKNRILNENNDTASLETQIEELKGLLAAANSEKDNAEERYSKQKAALIEEHRKEKQSLKNELAELKDLKEENDFLTDEISKLRKQKEPIIKTELSEEDMERLRDEGRDEERERYLGEHKVQEDRHKEEIKALKDKADDERITAVNAARKQEAAKYAAEIEKLKVENAALQSNAQSAPVPSGGSKEQLQFLISEIERAFNASQEIIGNMDDKEQQEKYRKALRNALKIMEEDLDAE